MLEKSREELDLVRTLTCVEATFGGIKGESF